jgi:UDP-N-acetyl-D-glucosamine dehydrogenase
MKQNLKIKISSKKAKICVIGLGYVGLPCLINFAKKGFNTLGIDLNFKLVNKLKKNINHLNKKKFNFKKYNINFSDNYSDINTCDVIIICVPTPLTINKTPDLSNLKQTIDLIGKNLKKNSLICFESTSYPGTTEEYFLPLIELNKFEIGKDIFLSFSPEREDPGNVNFDLTNITKVVSGYSENCLIHAEALYKTICENIYLVSNLKTAEFTKLLENIYRSVNIGLINELKILADKMNIDIYESINAAKTKPFGFQPFYPGPGLGGHCIPIDPYYLTWKAKEYSFNTRFTELSAQINDSMPYYVVEKINYCLNSKGKNFSNSKILLLGAAYKKNIGDTRESPFWKIQELLLNYNTKIYVNDPHVENLQKNILKKVKIYKNINEKIKMFDLIVILTDHDIYNYDLIYKNCDLIVDTRGRYNQDNIKIFRA